MKKELKLLLLVSVFINLAAGAIGPIYAIFVEDIGGDLLTAGSAYAAFSIAAGLLIFIISRWEDHVKHQEKLIVLGRTFSVLGFFGYIFVSNPTELFIVQIFLGIGAAIISPAYDSLYSRNLDKGKYAFEWGWWEASNWLVLGISALIGGAVAEYFGFKVLFILMFICSVISLIFTIILVKVTELDE